MWEIIVDIVFEKVENDIFGRASRRENFRSEPGRIPTREEIGDMAREAYQRFLEKLDKYTQNRPYQYGDFIAYRILSVTWIP